MTMYSPLSRKSSTMQFAGANKFVPYKPKSGVRTVSRKKRPANAQERVRCVRCNRIHLRSWLEANKCQCMRKER